VSAGRLRAPRGKSFIPVFTAPPPVDFGNFPCVSFHLDADSPNDRGVGDEWGEDDDEALDGWLSRHDVTVCGWTINADERIQMRHALKRLVVGNFPVFAAAGLVMPEFSQQDDEDFHTYSAPVYLARGRFTCLAPYALVTPAQVIAEVETTVIAD
jgi:hypothetical protein